jgi:hypothetical protein
MRIPITALAAAAIAALAFTAGADAQGTARKKRQAADNERVQPQRDRPGSSERFGYDASPEHHKFGSRDWWRAMEREGRGGFGDHM